MTIDKAFILAAGYGTRMLPLTAHTPKPLMQVGGRSLSSCALDRLEEAGVRDVVINTHHLAQQIPDHLRGRTSPKLTFSHEPQLLDSGGGIKAMVQHFGGKPFYVTAGDGLWEGPALTQMAGCWDESAMDILILLQPVASMRVAKGVGDYHILPGGQAVRARDKSGTHMFTSMRINHPRIFDGAPTGAFSYLALLDKAEEQGRLFALEHAGQWHHLSTPDDLKAVEAALTAR